MNNKHKRRASENKLIRGMLANDERAYVQVVSEHHPAMKRLARAIVGDAHADDVVQDAWINVTRGIKNFKGQSSLRTWMLAIVSNVAKTRHKKEKRHAAVDERDTHHISPGNDSNFDDQGQWCGTCAPIKWHMNTPEEIHSSEELKSALAAGIQSLAPSQRSALILREIENLSLPEVAEIMSKSEGNVRVLVHRARARMTQIIDLHQQGERQCSAKKMVGDARFMPNILGFQYT